MKERLRNGIKLRWINFLIAVLAGILAALLFLLSYNTLKAFRDMQQDGSRYATSLRLTAELQEAIGHMTDRVRTFVTTGDLESLDVYLAETEQTGRREQISGSFAELMEQTRAMEYLEEALRLSHASERIECRAILLAAAYYGVSLEDRPALSGIELSGEEQSLTGDDNLHLAITLLFDRDYQDLRRQIVENVDRCRDTLFMEMSQRQGDSESHFQYLLIGEVILVAAELLLMFLIMLAVRELLIEPMETFVTAIQNEQRVFIHQGAYELRFLSRAYNHMFDQLDKQREELFYRVSHDHLTGVYNRSVFDKAMATYELRSYTLILADVDRFKAINDTYGHSIGDQVLQKVARVLQDAFRSEDYVCRIGGDEFAVVMVYTSSQHKALIERKLKKLAHILRDTSDGLPSITLSMGIAFSDRREPGEDMYENADAALYSVKANGTDGLAFSDNPGTAAKRCKRRSK